MPFSVLHVDDNTADLELTSLAFAQVVPEVQYVPLDEGALYAEIRDLGTDPARPLPSLILLDMHMPLMSGFQAIGILKADERLKRIPMVILTSSSVNVVPDPLATPSEVLVVEKPCTYPGLVDLVGRLMSGLESNSLEAGKWDCISPRKAAEKT